MWHKDNTFLLILGVILLLTAFDHYVPDVFNWALPERSGDIRKYILPPVFLLSGAALSAGVLFEKYKDPKQKAPVHDE